MDHKHASFQTVVISSSQIYKKLSTLIWYNFTVIQFLLPEVLISYFYFFLFIIALKWFCGEYWLEQHEITFVENKTSFRAENKTVGVQTCDKTTKLNATKIFAGNPDLEMITSIIPVVCLLWFFRRPDNRDVVSYVSSLFKFSCTK